MSRRHVCLHARRWARVRPGAVLDRDGWRCRRVGRMEVDHVVPLDRGGDPWDMANLPMPRVPYREDGGGELSPPDPGECGMARARE